MHRCTELAKLGAGSVAPNPLVGAVLVYKDRIIGEGYHMQYGQAHAEVNCINSVQEADLERIPAATLYVSLEPCAHFGKTPPCADLIIAKKIPTVVIGCRDPFKEVDGKGMEKLLAAGVQIITPVLEKECRELNKRFFVFHRQHRPYIILKWAETANGIIGNRDLTRLLISQPLTNRLVHQWRGEEAAVMVGTQTALADNPALTNRLGKGGHPLRLVIDLNGRLPDTLHLFDGEVPTIVFNYLKEEEQKNLRYYRLERGGDIIRQVCDALYQLHIQSVLVEGGAAWLQSFIDANKYDEIRIISNMNMTAAAGVAAPVTAALQLQQSWQLQSDMIRFYTPQD